MKIITAFVLCSVLVLPVMLLPGCAGGAAAKDSGANFKDVEGKEWILAELRSGGTTVTIDRVKLAADNMAGVYTAAFKDGRIAGMGAPNRYFGPYTAGSGKSLSMGNMASTMMAAFKEPDALKEKEYYDYLSKVTRWDLRDGKLELYSSNAANAEAVLVFTAK